MRYSILALMIVAAIGQTETPVAAQSEQWKLDWKKGIDSPFARAEAPAVVFKGKLYLFGGFTDDLGAAEFLDYYDPVGNIWNRVNPMPTRLTHLNAVIDGTTVWLAGGFKGAHPGPVVNEVWKYDIAGDLWSKGPNLPEPRGGGGLAIVGRKLHYFGGYKADRDTHAGDHWCLDLDGGAEWKPLAELPDPRGHVSAAVVDGKIYALGGDHGHDKTQIDVASCHVFDPATNKWTEIASLPDGRSHFESSTIVHQGRILVVGGRCNSLKPPRDVVDDILQYDPKADSWSTVGTLPRKVLAPVAAIIGDKLVVTTGGYNNPRPMSHDTWFATLPKTER